MNGVAATAFADHVFWLDYVKALWPVVVGLSALLTSFVVLWLSSRYLTLAKFTDYRDDAEAESDKMLEVQRGHEARLVQVELLCAQSPTRQELQEDIAELAERMGGLETGLRVGLEGVRKQVEDTNTRVATTNDYLHLIIEKSMSK